MYSLKKFKIDRAVLLGLLSGLCWMAQGMGQANFGNSTKLKPFLKHFPSIDKSLEGLSPGEQSHRSLMVGLCTAIYELGLALGGLSTYFFGDMLGRKYMTYAAAVVVIGGIAIESSAFSLAQLLVGRILAGTGIGAFTSTVPAWVTETVLPKQRSLFVMAGGGFAITGVASMAWITLGLYIHQREHEIAWRLPLAIQGMVALIAIVGISFLDDSPRALVRRGKRTKAYRVLTKNRLGVNPAKVDEEFNEIIQAYENEIIAKDRSPWKINEHKQLRRTITAIVLSGLCQMAGINLITFYGAIIFEDIGLSSVKSRISLAGLQTWQALCAISAGWFAARFGRRKLLLGASATMCVCFCCCAGLESSGSTSTKYAILAFDAIQLAAFPIGLFLNPFLIASEIAGLLCRSAVLACAAAINWVMNFVLALVTPLGFDNLKYRYYIIYVATNAALFVFSYLFIPETAGLTLEEIDQAYVNSQNWFDIVKCADAVRAAGHVAPENLAQNKELEKPLDEKIEDIEKGW